MRRLRRLLDALGPAGIAGTGVFLFCLPFYFSALAPAQAEIARRSVGVKRIPAQPAPVSDAAADLDRFYARFPPIEGLHGELEALYGYARSSQVQLLQAEYRLETGTGGLTSYRVTLPVRGTYPQVRKFVDTMLREMPAASLDALRFERKRAADVQLEAQVRLTIYLRRAGT